MVSICLNTEGRGASFLLSTVALKEAEALSIVVQERSDSKLHLPAPLFEGSWYLATKLALVISLETALKPFDPNTGI